MNEQRAKESAVREEAERSPRLTKFAMDHASDSLFLIRSDAGFAYVNESTCRRLGYSREELLALTVFDVDPAFPREDWDAHWQALRERKSFTIETRHRTKTGEIFPVEVTVNYVEYEGAAYNFAFVRDITERKRAEEGIHRTNAKLEEMVAERTSEFEAVLEKLKAELEERTRTEEQLRVTQFSVDNTADAVFWVRPDGSFSYANKAACGMLGYSAEIENKNAELEQMNKLFVGRELRMVELKERIRELEQQADQRKP